MQNESSKFLTVIAIAITVTTISIMGIISTTRADTTGAYIPRTYQYGGEQEIIFPTALLGGYGPLEQANRGRRLSNDYRGTKQSAKRQLHTRYRNEAGASVRHNAYEDLTIYGKYLNRNTDATRTLHTKYFNEHGATPRHQAADRLFSTGHPDTITNAKLGKKLSRGYRGAPSVLPRFRNTRASRF